MGFNDEPMIRQKNYTEAEYNSKKEKSFNVAKRIIVSQQLSRIVGKNIFLSLVLFIFLIVLTSALPYFTDISIDFSPNTFNLRGGYFISLCIVFLILFTFFMFWYAFAYKRLEIMCIHLDGGLEGAVEVNEAAQRDNLLNSLSGTVANYSSLGGAVMLAINYLRKNNVKVITPRIFRIINAVLFIGQIVLACACLIKLFY